MASDRSQRECVVGYVLTKAWQMTLLQHVKRCLIFTWAVLCGGWWASGVFGIDPSYWLVLKPMLGLGLIWEPKIYKNESKQW